MDPRLLHYYNLELQHLRQTGAEFAEEFPKIAARLGMSGLEVADPYVERLLEGVGFLAARVQLKLDAEFPRFTQALLEIIYPHFVSPTPSMLVAQLKPDMKDPGLATGFTVARGTTMHGIAAGNETACEFRTAHDITLWPVEIVSARYFSFAPDLPLNTLPVSQRIKGGIRIRLKTAQGLKFSQTSIGRLCFYLGGLDEVANRLYELCLAAGLGVMVPATKGGTDYEFLPATTIRPIGFTDGEALLPVTLRSFQGYRLLQEYFSFPERFRFFELTGLERAIRRTSADEIELVILLSRGDATLESVVDAGNFALHCAPAVNLFPKPRIDRIQVKDSSYEFHVVADRTSPLDFEIYEVTSVVGHGTGVESDKPFLPFYSAYSTDEEHQQSAYFTTRREPRLVSMAERRRGSRSSYIGSEVFLSLVDPTEAPFSGDLRELSLGVLCTNRDLVLRMPIGIGDSDFSLDMAAPVVSVRVVSGPSRPTGPLANPQLLATDGAVAWRAISHLSLNYLSLVNSTPHEGAAALRDLLELYSAANDLGARKQIDGIASVRVGRVVRRLPAPGPLAFGRGLEIVLEVDELAFQGGSAFLLGAVLDQYFARYVSINSVVETVLRSQNRGEINRWRPHWGARPTL